MTSNPALATFEPMEIRPKRVIIVGAGFAGLGAARALAGKGLDLVLLEARNHHTFQPLLYQVATAALDGDDICFPVRGVFRGRAGLRVVMGELVGGDLDARRLCLSDGSSLDYEELVLACGAQTSSFGVPGVEEHALGLKSLSDALAIRNRVLGAFETADARPELLDEGLLNVVIVGGGPTGVELAGGLAELFDGSLRRDFPRLELGRARIVLVEAAERLLRGFSEASSRAARRTLEERGVEVLLGAGVARVGARELELAEGPRIPAATVIWAAGIRGHPVAGALGLPLGRGGRVLVGPDLCVPGRPEIHVIGDLAAAPGPGGLLPQVAPVAIQEAGYTARLILARAAGRELPPFAYRDKGSMATIGRNSAVTELPGGLRLSGFIGWLAWLFLHLLMLLGVRNRLNVLVNWAWNYLRYDRASRLILEAPARPPKSGVSEEQ